MNITTIRFIKVIKVLFLNILFAFAVQQTVVCQQHKDKFIGIGFHAFYPAQLNFPGVNGQTFFLDHMNPNWFYKISLHYGLAYYEHTEVVKYTYAETLPYLEQYAHYLLKADAGRWLLNNDNLFIGAASGIAGRYSSEYTVKYAFVSEINNLSRSGYIHQEKYFQPEIAEGYDFGTSFSIIFVWEMGENFSLKGETEYIGFLKRTNLFTVGVGMGYCF
jgi:hypothetical protein